MGKQNHILFLEAKLMPTLTGSFDVGEPSEARIWFVNKRFNPGLEIGDRVLMVEQSRQMLQRWDKILFCTHLIQSVHHHNCSLQPSSDRLLNVC